MIMTEQEPIKINGKAALSIGESADYLGVSETALNNILRRWNNNPENAGTQIEKRRRGFGQQRFIWVEDLDRLKEGHSAS
jgi:hypothetical protein